MYYNGNKVPLKSNIYRTNDNKKDNKESQRESK